MLATIITLRERLTEFTHLIMVMGKINEVDYNGK